MEDALNIFAADTVFIKFLQRPFNETLNDLISGKIHFHHLFCTLLRGLLENRFHVQRSNFRIVATLQKEQIVSYTWKTKSTDAQEMILLGVGAKETERKGKFKLH